jgi:hypothetical protein
MKIRNFKEIGQDPAFKKMLPWLFVAYLLASALIYVAVTSPSFSTKPLSEFQWGE